MELSISPTSSPAPRSRRSPPRRVKAIVRARAAPTYPRSRLDELTEQAKKAGRGRPGLVPGRRRRRRRRRPRRRPLRPASLGAGAGARPGADAGGSRGTSSSPSRTQSPDRLHRARDAARARSAAPPVGEGPHRYVWVVDFPMFEGIGADGNPQPAHHPFTMPYPEDLPLLGSDPLAVRSQAYDLVLNGWELGSGSVRIHRGDIQSRGVRRARHRARGGRGPLRVPARRLPLRGAAARRLRLRDRPAGGDPGGRGEHPRGHRLPQDPVGGRPAHGRPHAAARGEPGRAGHPGGGAAGPGRAPGPPARPAEATRRPSRA